MKLFKLTKPCANCPFLKQGAIPLNPGRLEGIIHDIERDANFICHKTAHGTGADVDEEGNYTGNGKEQPCAGAIIYFEKQGRSTQLVQVMTRMGRAMGEELFPRDAFMAHADVVIDPIDKP